MTTEKMTIHKALAELKTIDNRIADTIEEATFVVANKHTNQKIKGVSVETYCNNVKSTMQKVMSLIHRRNAIKNAVVLSNACTKVVINGKEYTVAEAIEMKNHGMDGRTYLKNTLARDLRMATAALEDGNGHKLEDKADNYIKTLYGDKADVKSLGTEAMKAREDFIKSQQYELVDPVGAKKVIEDLTDEINGFMVEVDAALSVSNATTEITIEY